MIIFKGLWNKRRRIAGNPQLSTHYPWGNFLMFVFLCNTSAVCDHKSICISKYYLLYATRWLCRGSSKYCCSVLNCQYSCSDLSTMFNVKLKFVKPVSQNGFLCCSENRFAKQKNRWWDWLKKKNNKKTTTKKNKDKMLFYAA